MAQRAKTFSGEPTQPQTSDERFERKDATDQVAIAKSSTVRRCESTRGGEENAIQSKESKRSSEESGVWRITSDCLGSRSRSRSRKISKEEKEKKMNAANIYNYTRPDPFHDLHLPRIFQTPFQLGMPETLYDRVIDSSDLTTGLASLRRRRRRLRRGGQKGGGIFPGPTGPSPSTIARMRKAVRTRHPTTRMRRRPAAASRALANSRVERASRTLTRGLRNVVKKTPLRPGRVNWHSVRDWVRWGRVLWRDWLTASFKNL